MNILLVGGTWDLENGKPSGFIKKFYQELTRYNNRIALYNGGNYEHLNYILESTKSFDVVLWFPNVENSFPKIRSVKKVNPYTILVGSKRNDGKYSFVDILNRSLAERHNLTIEFSIENDLFKMLLFDPLGSKWYEGNDIHDLVEALYKRILFISKARREHTYQAEGDIIVPNNEEFFEFVRESAEQFHQTIDHTEGMTRFMGNASFRGNNNIMYFSKRDVDKSKINQDNFVPCTLQDNTLLYYGDNKPSKDTITQANLYNLFPSINYMIHSHCYVEDGHYTFMPVPCGSLDEIDEVEKVVQTYYNGNHDLTSYKINYLGHGCLLLASTIQELKDNTFIPRIFPENLPNTEELLNNGLNNSELRLFRHKK